jgi:hypothetical protein
LHRGVVNPKLFRNFLLYRRQHLLASVQVHVGNPRVAAQRVVVAAVRQADVAELHGRDRLALEGTRSLSLVRVDLHEASFQNQIRFWGIAPSFAFVSQPQTNGVAERFNKTLKEQVIYGRTYRNIEELRIAVTAFMERYNRHWLVEKLGFRSPKQALCDFYNEQLKAAA